MFRILLKKQMTEIFRAYFYDAKKNKKRSVFSTVLFFGFFIILMVGIVGGMFFYLADSLCKLFAMVNMKWLYFLIMGMIAIALGTFGSVFNTYSGLYLSKDNDLLLSMPIPIRSILTIRLVSVYLMGLMYSAIVMLPAVIVYWIEVEATLLTIVGPVLLILLISLLVLILSCVLGWCVAKISLKLKNKSFITVILSLCFFALYYFVYFKAQDLIQNLLMNAAVYGEKVKGSAYPVYLFGKIGEGDLLAMLLYTAVIAVLCALTFVVLSRSFIKIATSSGSVKKVVYKEKKEKRKTPFMAILQKEFGRFLSSPNYMLNCGLGVIALPIVGVVMLFKGNDILDFMNMIFGSEREGMLIVLVVTALSLLASMNDMVVPSVSLEGKNIWIAQSLPMDLWQVLRAKLSVQLLLTIVPLIVCEICFVFVMPSHGIETILGMIVPIVFAIFLTLFGLFLGLQMPNLSWTNELAPIKQSLSVVISMFGGWVVSIVLSVLYYTTAYPMGVSLYFAVILVAFAIASVVLCIWLKKKGTIIFANLSA